MTKVFPPGERECGRAVSNVTLEIAPGTALLVTGASGCGKTTLLGLIGCLLRPTAGRVRVGEVDTTELHEDALAHLRRRRFGFVFQRLDLVAGATALLNVMIPALPAGRRDGELADAARRLLGELGLERRTCEPVERLSGAERQRVALARALVNDPDVLVADEPTARQDASARRAFVALVERLASEGRTVVAASHDPFLTSSCAFPERLELLDGSVAARGRR